MLLHANLHFTPHSRLYFMGYTTLAHFSKGFILSQNKLKVKIKKLKSNLFKLFNIFVYLNLSTSFYVISYTNCVTTLQVDTKSFIKKFILFLTCEFK